MTAQLERVLYTARATADGGRQGRSVSDDGRLDVSLSSPASMGGDDGSGHQPRAAVRGRLRRLLPLGS